MPSQHGVHIAMPDDDVIAKAVDYDVTREFRTLPYTLRQHGYATTMVGKWHLGNYRQPGHGFDHWVAFTKGHTTDFYDNDVYADGEIQQVDRPAHRRALQRPGDRLHHLTWPGTDRSSCR